MLFLTGYYVLYTKVFVFLISKVMISLKNFKFTLSSMKSGNREKQTNQNLKMTLFFRTNGATYLLILLLFHVFQKLKTN